MNPEHTYGDLKLGFADWPSIEDAPARTTCPRCGWAEGRWSFHFIHGWVWTPCTDPWHMRKQTPDV